MTKSILMVILMLMTVIGAKAQSNEYIEELYKFTQDDKALDYFYEKIFYDSDDNTRMAAKKAKPEDIIGEWWYFSDNWNFKADGTYEHHTLIQSEKPGVRVLTTRGTWILDKGIITPKSDNKNADGTLYKAELIKDEEERQNEIESTKKWKNYEAIYDDKRAILEINRVDKDYLIMFTPDSLRDSEEEFITRVERLVRPAFAIASKKNNQ